MLSIMLLQTVGQVTKLVTYVRIKLITYNYLKLYCKFIKIFDGILKLVELLATVDQENFVVKKVTWNKSSMHFNFVKAEA